MRQFLSNLEQKEFTVCGDEVKLQLLGWAGFEGARVKRFVLTVNGEQAGEFTYSTHERPDVSEVHPFLSESGEMGFHVIWTQKIDKVSREDKMLLLALCEDDAAIVWETKDGGIGRHMNGDTLKYSLDKITMDDNWTEVAGWAISFAGDPIPEFELVCEDGSKPEFRYRATDRRDAAKMLLGEEADPYVGYIVKFQQQEGKKYTLVMKNSLEEVSEEMDLPAEWKIQKEANRLYKPMKTVLKEYSTRTLGEDLEALRSGGIAGLQDQWKLRNATEKAGYEVWYLKNRADKETLEAQKQEQFAYAPVISIIVPAYQTPKKFLKQMIKSVQDQTYPRWELCIADGSDKDDSVARAMLPYVKADSRIRYRKLKENKGISGNTNAALRLATGEVIALLDHDDILAPDALYELVKAFNLRESVDVVYTDEDKISMDLKTHFDPHFKTDFNLDLFRSNNYICHLFAAKRSIVDQVKGFRKDFDGSQDFDFILRCTELAREVYHVPKVLYHWRMHMQSTAANPESKMYCYEAGKRAIEAHLKRVGQKGTVSMTDYLGYYQIDYEKKEESLVSILIPNKDEKESLKVCIESILKKTLYPNYEIIIIENNSTSDEIFEYYKELEQNEKIRVVYWKDIFNYSAINNFGAAHAKGDYLVLLNNDTEIIEPRWLDMMLGDCQREEVGIVGCKLLYPDDTIQHCGVIIGMGGIAGHVFTGESRQSTGYFSKTLLQQDLSAVTAACLMISKQLFDEIGGLDEGLKVAFNDVDFCLRVRKTGHLVMLDPRVLLYHYESKSRGTEDTPEKMRRFDSEVNFMKERWSEILEAGDPYYNKNLTLLRGDCSLADEKEFKERNR